MRNFVVLFAYALLLVGDVCAGRRGRRFRLRPPSNEALFVKSGRRVAELTVDKNDLRAMCESKITPGVPSRRVMETTFGARGAAFLEGEGIDRKLLCESKLYEEVKKDDMVARKETVGTAIISHEDNIGNLLNESNRGPSPDKNREFSVEAESTATFGGGKKGLPSANVQASAEGLSGIGFKSKTRSFTTLQNRRKAKRRNLMEMEHLKETDFEVAL